MKDIEIKDKKDFLNFFNIFKKIKTLKSELHINKNDSDFINLINLRKKFNVKFKKISVPEYAVVVFLLSTVFINSELAKLIFDSYKVFFLSFIYLGSVVLLPMACLLGLTFCLNMIKLKYYSFKYKYDKNKPNFIHFFNEIYYLSFKNKEKNYNLNDIILKFNQEELEILKEYDISIVDEDKIYTNLIHFLDNNLIKEEKLNYNDFKENIDYLLKDISSYHNSSDILSQLKLIKRLNNGNSNNSLTKDSTLIHNF